MRGMPVYSKGEGKMFNKFESGLYKAIYYFCSFLMISMVAIIFLQVLARYIFHNSLSWSEELGRYLFVWMTFFGTALALRQRAHVALDSLIKLFPNWLNRIIVVLGYIAMIIFSSVLTYDGFAMFRLGSRQVSAAMQIPMIWVYYALPISCILIIFYLCKNLVDDIRSWKGD